MDCGSTVGKEAKERNEVKPKRFYETNSNSWRTKQGIVWRTCPNCVMSKARMRRLADRRGKEIRKCNQCGTVWEVQ